MDRDPEDGWAKDDWAEASRLSFEPRASGTRNGTKVRGDAKLIVSSMARSDDTADGGYAHRRSCTTERRHEPGIFRSPPG